MIESKELIWDYVNKVDHYVVVTTNCVLDKNKHLVMGKGIALEAKQRFPDLPKFLGDWLIANYGICQSDGCVFDYTSVECPHNIIALQTKRAWQDPSSLYLIELAINSISELALQYPFRIYHLPKVGCGKGGLDWVSQVKPLCQKLPDNCVVHI